ncbi:MAG: HNH endonuclease [Candidatus Aenigmarchaeota archaeon]|nr:HNH endonuclease [Candidatus Aenigmarchaeota archaeon]
MKDPLGLGSYGVGLNYGNNNSKTARKPISKDLRNTVWIKYMRKKAEGKCYCCRIRTIHVTDFQVGHNKAVSKGGRNNISNLRPICVPCNRGMKTMTIEKYREKYFGNKNSAKPQPTKKKLKKKAKIYDPFGFAKFVN